MTAVWNEWYRYYRTFAVLVCIASSVLSCFISCVCSEWYCAINLLQRVWNVFDQIDWLLVVIELQYVLIKRAVEELQTTGGVKKIPLCCYITVHCAIWSQRGLATCKALHCTRDLWILSFAERVLWYQVCQCLLQMILNFIVAFPRHLDLEWVE